MSELDSSSRFILQVVRNEFDVSQLDFDDVDWSELFSLATKHRIFPQLYKVIKEFIPETFKERYLIQDQLYRHKVDTMLEALSDLSCVSKDAKIRFLLIKGLPLSVLIYNDIYARQINDIDILVAADDVHRTDYALRKSGYVQPLKYNRDDGKIELLPFTTSRLKNSKHQYEYFKFGENVSKVEVHSYLTNFKPFMEDILWNTAGVEIDGILYNTLDLEHMCLYLFINAYDSSETYEALQMKVLVRDYVDIYECLKKYMSQINWGKFYMLVEKYGFGLKYNLMLDNLSYLYPNNHVLEMLREIDQLYSKESEMLPSHIRLDFISRIFQPELRKQMALARLKERVCTPQKSVAQINVYPCEYNWSIENMERLECDLNIDIRYCLRYSEKGLYVTLKLDDQISRDFDKYMIAFTLLNNDPNNENLYHVFEATMEDGQVTVLKKDYKYHYSTYVFEWNDGEQMLTEGVFSKGDQIEYFIPFSVIGSNPFQRKCDFSGQMDLYKKIYPSVYHLVNNVPIDIFEADVLKFS